MDWVRLGHSGVDLTGVGGVLHDVTLEQLAAHSKKNDAWIAIRGKVKVPILSMRTVRKQVREHT
jgi:cytochrome-b5 reductase